jgi:histone H3/H4
MAGPKKITPYLLFSTESREKAKQQLIDAGDPKPGMGDIAKTVGVMWHALGDDGKEVRRDFPANAPRRRERAPGPSPRDLVEIQNPSRLRLLERPAPRRRHPTKRPRTHPHRTFTPPLWFPQAYKTRAEEENAKAAAAYAAAVESGEVDEDADAENADRDANEPDVALPLARVKRIMKLDKEVKNCANDACRTITRATELFVESLVEGAFVSMRAQKRKTIKHGDVEHHVLRKPRLEFLGDHVWASRPRGAETQAAASLRAGGASEADKENKESADGTAGPEETVTPPRSAPEAPAGARQVTDFFRAERRSEGADGDENDAPAGAGEDAATE